MATTVSHVLDLLQQLHDECINGRTLREDEIATLHELKVLYTRIREESVKQARIDNVSVRRVARMWRVTDGRVSQIYPTKPVTQRKPH